jgi:tRNA G18 (ribose-2'-O)-methylase SpoU
MKEVTESDVLAFLKDKRAEGYLLCGLEQTTTSTPLQKFDFPAKCVLLLGTLHQAINCGREEIHLADRDPTSHPF